MKTQEEIKNLVCSSCWEDVFASEQFRLLCACRCGRDEHCNATVKVEKTVEQIKTSANAGCSWCSFLYTFTSRNEDQRRHADSLVFTLCDFKLSYSTPHGKNTFVFDLSWKTEGYNLGWFLRLHAFADPEDPAAVLTTARPLQPQVYSDLATYQIKSWLAECSDHESCPPQLDTVLPTRVIEVAPADYPEQPRLVVSSGENVKRGRFVALSYCWGGECKGALIGSKLKQYERLLPLHNLARTFCDAIAVTKAIGVPYLWIDALCIIQDDNMDKRSEISRMEQVYQNAVLTIVAACSSTASQGFLDQRPKPKEAYLLPFRVSESQYGTFYVNDLEIVEYDEECEPVHARAWTLQESLLAPRYLVYSSHTLQWRCKSGVKNLGDSLHIVSYADEDKNSQSLYMLGKIDKEPREGLRRWIKLVEAYARRTASHPHDKLNAISAIAKGFTPVLGPDYFAGLWSYSIISQLLWKPFNAWNGDDINTRPASYRAPSWSWASIDGELSMDWDIMDSEDEEHSTYICDFVSCRVVPRLETFPFGEVLSGSIKLKGVLRKAWLHPAYRTIHWLVGDGSLQAAELHHKNELKQLEGDKVTDDEDPDSSSDVYRGGQSPDAFHDEGREQPPTLVFCLPIVTLNDPETAYGLLLVETETGAKEFKRVGCFESVPQEAFDELPQREVIIV